MKPVFLPPSSGFLPGFTLFSSFPVSLPYLLSQNLCLHITVFSFLVIGPLFLQLVPLSDLFPEKKCITRLSPFKFVIFNSSGPEYQSVFFLFILFPDINHSKFLLTLQTYSFSLFLILSRCSGFLFHIVNRK